MLDNRVIEFVLELMRALLIDEPSGHVRGGLAKLFARRRTNDSRRAIMSVHHNNRKRLLHRLLTEPDEDP